MHPPGFIALKLQAEEIQITDSENVVAHRLEEHLRSTLTLVVKQITFKEDSSRTIGADEIG